MFIQDQSYYERHDFPIKPASIDFHTVHPEHIALPYHGKMPRDHSKSSAWIWITTTGTKKFNPIFCIKDTNGHIFKQQIIATDKEITSILQPFLSTEDTGLSPQAAGEWKRRLSEYQKTA